MRVIEQTFYVERPAGVVFDFLVTAANIPLWQTGVSSAEQLADGEPQVGMRIVQRGPALGPRGEQISQITELERPRLFAAEILEGPLVPCSIAYALTDDGGRTIVRVTVQYVVSGILRRIFAPILHHLMARALRREHAKLARVLEAG